MKIPQKPHENPMKIPWKKWKSHEIPWSIPWKKTGTSPKTWDQKRPRWAPRLEVQILLGFAGALRGLRGALRLALTDAGIASVVVDMLNIKGLPGRTPQGSGGSFKDRKPIGEVCCCESMAEQMNWWIERWLERRPIYLSIYLPVDLTEYLTNWLTNWRTNGLTNEQTNQLSNRQIT